MTEEKKRIYDEIQIRIRQKAQIEREIVDLWEKYYALNKKNNVANNG